MDRNDFKAWLNNMNEGNKNSEQFSEIVNYAIGQSVQIMKSFWVVHVSAKHAKMAKDLESLMNVQQVIAKEIDDMGEELAGILNAIPDNAKLTKRIKAMLLHIAKRIVSDIEMAEVVGE